VESPKDTVFLAVRDAAAGTTPMDMKEPKQFIITEVPGRRLAVVGMVNSGTALALWSCDPFLPSRLSAGRWVLSFRSHDPGVCFSDQIRAR